MPTAKRRASSGKRRPNSWRTSSRRGRATTRRSDRVTRRLQRVQLQRWLRRQCRHDRWCPGSGRSGRGVVNRRGVARPRQRQRPRPAAGIATRRSRMATRRRSITCWRRRTCSRSSRASSARASTRTSRPAARRSVHAGRLSDRDPMVAYFTFPPDVVAPVLSVAWRSDRRGDGTRWRGGDLRHADGDGQSRSVRQRHVRAGQRHVFALGTTACTCSAQDAAGNTSHASFTVTVRDTTRPALTLPASDHRRGDLAGRQGDHVYRHRDRRGDGHLRR